MRWGDPTFVALFAAWGQWISAIGSFLAVGVAIWISLYANKAAQQQSRQDRYDTARPVLVMSDTDLQYDTTAHAFINSKLRSYDQYSRICVQKDLWTWIDWNEEKQTTNVKNVGAGTAFNITSMMFGPEAVSGNSKTFDAKNICWKYKINILSANENKQCEYYKSIYQFLKKGDIRGYSFLAPPQPIVDPSDRERLYTELVAVCRVVITYHDVYKRKHASIFDLDVRGYWIMKAILEDIPMDIYDLERANQPSRIPLLKRLLKNSNR